MLNDSAKILKITYDSGGGRYSNNTILKISKDSTFYMSEKNYNPQEGRYKNYVIRSIKTDSVFWKHLVSSINLSDFDKAQNGSNNRERDGTDTQITIDTFSNSQFRTHFHIIGGNDKKLDNFLNELNNELDNFNK